MAPLFDLFLHAWRAPCWTTMSPAVRRTSLPSESSSHTSPSSTRSVVDRRGGVHAGVVGFEELSDARGVLHGLGASRSVVERWVGEDRVGGRVSRMKRVSPGAGNIDVTSVWGRCRREAAGARVGTPDQGLAEARSVNEIVPTGWLPVALHDARTGPISADHNSSDALIRLPPTGRGRRFTRSLARQSEAVHDDCDEVDSNDRPEVEVTSRFRFVGVSRGCVRDNARGDTARCSVRRIARHWEVDSRQTARCSGATGCSRSTGSTRRTFSSRRNSRSSQRSSEQLGWSTSMSYSTRPPSLSRRARAYDLVVTDTLFPFVPSLLAWGHDEATIRSFLSRLRTALQPLQPVIVYLDGEPADALPPRRPAVVTRGSVHSSPRSRPTRPCRPYRGLPIPWRICATNATSPFEPWPRRATWWLSSATLTGGHRKISRRTPANSSPRSPDTNKDALYAVRG